MPGHQRQSARLALNLCGDQPPPGPTGVAGIGRSSSSFAACGVFQSSRTRPPVSREVGLSAQ